MIDSGADVSVIPPILADNQRLSSGFTIQAVNQTSITYGERMPKLDLGLRRFFPMLFLLLMFPTPSLVPIPLNDSIFPSVFAGCASLIT